MIPVYKSYAESKLLNSTKYTRLAPSSLGLVASTMSTIFPVVYNLVAQIVVLFPNAMLVRNHLESVTSKYPNLLDI